MIEIEYQAARTEIKWVCGEECLRALTGAVVKWIEKKTAALEKP